MNAVVLAVVVMLILSVSRVHVVIALIVGALVGGVTAGMGLTATMESFTEGIANGASIALSYAMLGAFAVAISHSGMPRAFANLVVARAGAHGVGPDAGEARIAHAAPLVKWGLLAVILVVSIMSQNVVPVHIAFIPLLIPPLLIAFNRFGVDRRLLACIMTFGLITTYMYLPYGFGNVFLNEILLKNINEAGMDTSGINVMDAMGIPALGMVAGLLIAVFFTYRKPRHYDDLPVAGEDVTDVGKPVGKYPIIVAVVAIGISLGIQIWADSLLLGALVGFAVFVAARVINWGEADGVFDRGMKMMAMIGFIMIAAQGFAQVMKDTGQVDSLVTGSAEMFAGNQAMAALAMLLVGLLVTMGIGSSFSTLPIITTIYVPLCLSLGFSPLATVSLIGTAGALGDAGSPASDSTLGPTAGLNADGQHDHIRDTVIPTFIHYNIPLLLAGWVAALVL
ncbi:MAG: Na+/H+ antiporter NhaC family protein [Dermatophilus congolensis]|nr:Na+/H+ antiporter NhaC family protein [Dermatophilus congolensis]